MKFLSSGRMMQASGCLLCAAVAWKISILGLVGTEFSGGNLTGVLLTLSIIGLAVFALMIIVTFIHERLAAIGAVLAALLCFPLYFYFVAPGFVQRMMPGDYSVRAQGTFVWNGWAASGMLTLAVIVYLSIRTVANRTGSTNFTLNLPQAMTLAIEAIVRFQAITSVPQIPAFGRQTPISRVPPLDRQHAAR